MMAASSHQGPAGSDLSRCVHCGLCLESCPTYLLTGMETESPRGRIHLIQAVQEERIPPTAAYRSHLERCLVCRACEAACPSGVPFGRIMEHARAVLPAERRTARERLARWLLFEKLLPNTQRLRRAAIALRWYQRTGLRSALESLGLLGRLPPALRQMERAMPDLSDAFFEEDGRFFPARGAARLRVALFTGCVMPLVYGRVHRATLRVLQQLGCDVIVPRLQGCCGALNVHAGERATARTMARRNIRAVLDLDPDYLAVNSAGCGSTLKEYGELLADDPVWHQRAETFASRVLDVHELIARLPFRDGLGPVQGRVTYQESCHLVHAQRVQVEPRAILRSIPGLEVVDLPHADSCCGSAGLYSFVQHELSGRILERKLAAIASTGAETVVTANPGCMLQLESGVRRAGLNVDVRHLVEVLDWSYQAGGHEKAEMATTPHEAG